LVDRDFVQDLGLPFLAHRLRRASEAILEGTTSLLRTEGFNGPARSVSILLLLKEHGPLGITEIAYWLRLSHPLIIKMAAALEEGGYVVQHRDPKDNRRRLIALMEKGVEQADRIEEISAIIAQGLRNLFEEMGTDLLDAVARFETAVASCPMGRRFQHAKREKQGV
jgi:DNA-binding MarR family transcriptional regulator